MATFYPSESALARARRIAASVKKTKKTKKTKSRSAYGAGYIRDTIMQCPRHHVDYVLRLSNREAPALLFTTVQKKVVSTHYKSQQSGSVNRCGCEASRANQSTLDLPVLTIVKLADSG